jgi:hypothetical protein
VTPVGHQLSTKKSKSNKQIECPPCCYLTWYQNSSPTKAWFLNITQCRKCRSKLEGTGSEGRAQALTAVLLRLLGCDAVTLGEWFLTLRRLVVSALSMVSIARREHQFLIYRWPLKMSATILSRFGNHSPKDRASCPNRLRVRRSDLHKWHNVHTKHRSIGWTVAAGGHRERFFQQPPTVPSVRKEGRNTGQKLQNCQNLVIYCSKLPDDFGLNASNKSAKNASSEHETYSWQKTASRYTHLH